MNILFNLKNKDFQTRITVLDYLRRQLVMNDYYDGRYGDSMNNGNEYIRFHNGSVETWVLIPQDLFDVFVKQTFKSRSGEILNIKIGKTIYIQDDVNTPTPIYHKMVIQSPSYNIRPDFKISYSNVKTQVYKTRRSNSMSGFIRIMDNIKENGFVFDFTIVPQGSAENQHI